MKEDVNNRSTVEYNLMVSHELCKNLHELFNYTKFELISYFFIKKTISFVLFYILRYILYITRILILQHFFDTYIKIIYALYSVDWVITPKTKLHRLIITIIVKTRIITQIIAMFGLSASFKIRILIAISIISIIYYYYSFVHFEFVLRTGLLRSRKWFCIIRDIVLLFRFWVT